MMLHFPQLALSNSFTLGQFSRIFVLGLIAGSAEGQSGTLNYQPITFEGRLNWTLVNTIGPSSLLGGGMSAGLGTLLNHPAEYGTHWDGFASRYGMRLTGVAASNIMKPAWAICGAKIRVISAIGDSRLATGCATLSK
jgi:hypothetical protein